MMHLRDPAHVILNPNRENIKLEVVMRPPSQQTQGHLDVILHDISSELKTNKLEYPLTIVYTDTPVIAYCYSTMNELLGSEQYVGDAIPENRVFAQFHAEYRETMKQHITREICSQKSRILLVFVTIVLGMGLNAPNIRKMIHYKPPKTLENYFKEIGRAGRDGVPAQATLYYNNTDVRSNRPGITQGIITYCKQTTQCRRDSLLRYFGHGLETSSPRPSCCDLCDVKLK